MGSTDRPDPKDGTPGPDGGDGPPTDKGLWSWLRSGSWVPRGLGVLAAGLAGLVAGQVLRGGVTVGGLPLADVPVPAEVGGISRLTGSDQFVVLVMWAAAVGFAYLCGSVVRAVVADRWITKVSAGGAETGRVDADQTAQIRQIHESLTQVVAAVETLRHDVARAAEDAGVALGGVEDLSDGMAALAAAVDDLAGGPAAGSDGG